MPTGRIRRLRKNEMPLQSVKQSPATSRFGGLDGLRAIAVGLVLVYHFFPDVLPGGFLGVDLFFAISGFLITSLLLREYGKNGRIALADFWRRRARRLLPVLALVILVSTSLARFVGGDLLVGIGKQIAGASFFVSNWVYIATGSDYFTRDNPEIFRNTWSLSIEEQFYIVLPLLVLLLLKSRSVWLRALIFFLLAVASAWRMFALSVADADATRIYFGSDSHVFGLLLGAAAAVVLHQRLKTDPPQARPTTQAGYIAVAVLGLGVIAWLAFTLQEGSQASFQGGFQIATVVAVLVIAAVTRPGAWVGRALDIQPLKWIGERSYGIYMWHWPLLVIFAAAFEASLPTWGIGVLALVVTLALSALSFTYVEQPVREHGLRKSVAVLFQSLRLPTIRQRTVTMGLLVTLIITLPLTVNAIATAPQMSSAATAIARGQAALDDQAANAGEENASIEEGTAGAADGDLSTAAAPPLVPVTPKGTDITAVGDSVMLASLPELSEAYPGISIDASVSRGMGAGVGIVQQLAASSAMRSVVVIGLATNGTIADEELAQMRELTGNRPLVFVNAYGERDWIPGVNQQLLAFAQQHRGVVVADWQGLVTGVPGALAGDEIHPNPSGGEIYAQSLQRAFDELLTPSEAIGYGVPRR